MYSFSRFFLCISRISVKTHDKWGRHIENTLHTYSHMRRIVKCPDIHSVVVCVCITPNNCKHVFTPIHINKLQYLRSSDWNECKLSSIAVVVVIVVVHFHLTTSHTNLNLVLLHILFGDLCLLGCLCSCFDWKIALESKYCPFGE